MREPGCGPEPAAVGAGLDLRRRQPHAGGPDRRGPVAEDPGLGAGFQHSRSGWPDRAEEAGSALQARRCATAGADGGHRSGTGTRPARCRAMAAEGLGRLAVRAVRRQPGREQRRLRGEATGLFQALGASTPVRAGPGSPGGV